MKNVVQGRACCRLRPVRAGGLAGTCWWGREGFLSWGETMCILVTQSCPTLCNPVDCSPSGSSVHKDSPGKNTGVGCHALLQGIYPTQGSDPRLLVSCIAGGLFTTSTTWEAPRLLNSGVLPFLGFFPGWGYWP